eukprot:scaffold37826_cov219-Skeletonema_marinoi.AAC.3
MQAAQPLPSVRQEVCNHLVRSRHCSAGRHHRVIKDVSRCHKIIHYDGIESPSFGGTVSP